MHRPAHPRRPRRPDGATGRGRTRRWRLPSHAGGGLRPPRIGRATSASQPAPANSARRSPTATRSIGLASRRASTSATPSGSPGMLSRCALRLLIAMVSGYLGSTASRGTEGVGEAATRSVVFASMLIISATSFWSSSSSSSIRRCPDDRRAIRSRLQGLRPADGARRHFVRDSRRPGVLPARTQRDGQERHLAAHCRARAAGQRQGVRGGRRHHRAGWARTGRGPKAYGVSVSTRGAIRLNVGRRERGVSDAPPYGVVRGRHSPAGGAKARGCRTRQGLRQDAGGFSPAG